MTDDQFEDELDQDVDDEETEEEGSVEDGTLSPAKNIENKVLKLSLKYGKGQTSYIYWPAILSELTEDRLHMTAKFFGDTPITVEEVRDILELIEGHDEPLNIKDFEWTPVVFATKNDGGVPVLEFTKFPPILDTIHNSLSKFRRDDYPTYKPHITVTQDVWEKIEADKLTPEQVGLELLPLELSIKGLVVYKWGEDAGDVEEIDGRDVRTNNPTGESLAKQIVHGISSLSGK